MIAVVEPQPAQADDWYARLLLNTLETRRPLRTLVLSGRPRELASAGVTSPCSVRITRGKESFWLPVNCAHSALPFQVDVFDLVVIHDLVSQGDERMLAAVRRMMPGSSQLLVLGRGWFSPLRLRKPGREARAFRPSWLRGRLQQQGFVPRGISGRGVGGVDLPLDQGVNKILQSGGDRLAIRARRSEGRPNIRLVRFSRPKAVFGRGAAWDGINRETL